MISEKSFLLFDKQIQLFFGSIDKNFRYFSCVDTVLFSPNEPFEVSTNIGSVTSNAIFAKAGSILRVSTRINKAIIIFHGPLFSFHYKLNKCQPITCKITKLQLLAHLGDVYQYLNNSSKNNTPIIFDTNDFLQYRSFFTKREKKQRDIKALKVYNILVKSVSSNVQLSHLCESVGLSKSRLLEIFSLGFSVSPKKLTNWLRIIETCRLISEGFKPTQAALESGFSDYSQFCRSFKNNCGHSPCTLARRKNEVHVAYAGKLDQKFFLDLRSRKP